jgi:RNA 2',3'-cyclic 3'-phosphodiesterase
MIRSFVAIELPEDLKKTIAEYLGELIQIPSKVKWVSPRQTHLTLKFFGSITQEALEKISEVLFPVIADYPPFQLTLKGLGGFPNLFRPRVIWLSLGGGTENLQRLHQTIERALVLLGIPEENRPFQGHLTLGRNKDNKINEVLYQRLSKGLEEETRPFEVRELILFRSDLKPAGAVHTKLRTFSLNRHAPPFRAWHQET